MFLLKMLNFNGVYLVPSLTVLEKLFFHILEQHFFYVLIG